MECSHHHDALGSDVWKKAMDVEYECSHHLLECSQNMALSFTMQGSECHRLQIGLQDEEEI
jgi:hypothetical protein